MVITFSQFQDFEMSKNKRKRVVVIRNKIRNNSRIDSDESIQKVTEDLGPGAVTVVDWFKERWDRQTKDKRRQREEKRKKEKWNRKMECRKRPLQFTKNNEKNKFDKILESWFL